MNEYEELAQEAWELQVSLFYRRDGSERLERLYRKARARYTRRAELLADWELMRMESSIEARAYDD